MEFQAQLVLTAISGLCFSIFLGLRSVSFVLASVRRPFTRPHLLLVLTTRSYTYHTHTHTHTHFFYTYFCFERLCIFLLLVRSFSLNPSSSSSSCWPRVRIFKLLPPPPPEVAAAATVWRQVVFCPRFVLFFFFVVVFLLFSFSLIQKSLNLWTSSLNATVRSDILKSSSRCDSWRREMYRLFQRSAKAASSRSSWSSWFSWSSCSVDNSADRLKPFERTMTTQDETFLDEQVSRKRSKTDVGDDILMSNEGNVMIFTPCFNLNAD